MINGNRIRIHNNRMTGAGFESRRPINYGSTPDPDKKIRSIQRILILTVSKVAFPAYPVLNMWVVPEYCYLTLEYFKDAKYTCLIENR
jgi:hypothetical protein